MIGTFLNAAAILVGGILGSLIGGRLSERFRQVVVYGMGLFTLAYGFSMFLKTQNPLIVLGGMLIGSLLGEWWQIESGMERLGSWLEKRLMQAKPFSERSDRFVQGFLTASLLFCVGPMAILGSIQDGLTGDHSLLAVKSVLDGFASLAFASSLGVGVMLSAPILLVYQGGLSLLAAQSQAMITSSMIAELSATGGILLMSIAISSLLEIRKIRSGNFLPALVIAPLLVALLAFIGVKMP